jgi:hypothetical protein
MNIVVLVFAEVAEVGMKVNDSSSNVTKVRMAPSEWLAFRFYLDLPSRQRKGTMLHRKNHYGAHTGLINVSSDNILLMTLIRRRGAFFAPPDVGYAHEGLPNL